MIDWLRDDPPKVCARCARPVRLGWQQPAPEHQGKRVWVAVRRWPDGYICAGCFATACETYGRCAICQVDRLVPGIADNGDRVVHRLRRRPGRLHLSALRRGRLA